MLIMHFLTISSMKYYIYYIIIYNFSRWPKSFNVFVVIP